MMIYPDGVDKFPEPVWADEEWQRHENPKEIKVDYLESDIWWYRK